MSAPKQTSSRRTRTHIGPWQLGRTLGRGSSGRVRLAKHAETGQLAAVKIVPKAQVENSYGLEREVIIMKLIGHPNIMGLYDVWENKGELYLVLEYIEGGELFDYLVRRGRLNEREAVYYFRQICCGVQYCHQFNICHRDLKPENLLLDRHRNIKIADFGMAALETQDRMLETSCGSPHYASPEIVAGRTYHGAPSDIWSCGVILFALVTGHLPFDDENIRVLLRKVQAGRFSIPSFVGPEARDLIAKMLRVDPEQRITMAEIFEHPLLRKHPVKGGAGAQPSAQPAVDATHPVRCAEEIDPEILRNLSTLWHHTTQDQIVAQLLSEEPNPEKTFYCLLQRYRQSHRASAKRAPPRSGSRTSLHSKRSASSRSLRAVPRQQRISMASINSRFVAERTAPRAPGGTSGAREADAPASAPASGPDSSTPQIQPAAASSPIESPVKAAPTATKPAAASRPENSFALLIDKAFQQEPQEELLPMIFEEERFADAPERRVPRKPVTPSLASPATMSGATNSTVTLPGVAPSALSSNTALPRGLPHPGVPYPEHRASSGSYASYVTATSHATQRTSAMSYATANSRPMSMQSTGTAGASSVGAPGSARTGPVLRPVSMQDPAKSEISVARRENKRESSASMPVDLERRPTKKLGEFARPNVGAGTSGTPGTAPTPAGTASTPGRNPLQTIENSYPPLAAQKEKLSILRRFTPKRNKTPTATVSSSDYNRPPTPPSSSGAGETKQNWLMKMLNLSQGSPQKTLLSTASVATLRSVIVAVLQEWTAYGLVFESSDNLITATINSKNAFKLRMSRFTIRVAPLNSGASAVCTQVRGAQLSYLRFVGELERVLGNKNLLGPPLK